MRSGAAYAEYALLKGPKLYSASWQRPAIRNARITFVRCLCFTSQADQRDHRYRRTLGSCAPVLERRGEARVTKRVTKR
jgi:hypothetical protein